MPLIIVIDAVAILGLGFGLGWPWGVVASLGCLLVPLAVMRLLMLRTMVYRGGEEARQTLRARVIRLTPEQVEAGRRALPESGED